MATLKFWILELKPHWYRLFISCLPTTRNWVFVLTCLVGFTFRRGLLRDLLISKITKFFSWVKGRPQ